MGKQKDIMEQYIYFFFTLIFFLYIYHLPYILKIDFIYIHPYNNVLYRLAKKQVQIVHKTATERQTDRKTN